MVEIQTCGCDTGSAGGHNGLTSSSGIDKTRGRSRPRQHKSQSALHCVISFPLRLERDCESFTSRDCEISMRYLGERRAATGGATLVYRRTCVSRHCRLLSLQRYEERSTEITSNRDWRRMFWIERFCARTNTQPQRDHETCRIAVEEATVVVLPDVWRTSTGQRHADRVD